MTNVWSEKWCECFIWLYISREKQVKLTMLCYVMLCCVIRLFYVKLCYVVLCYVMLRYVILCYVTLRYVMSCHVMLCYVVLHYVTLHHVMSCYVMLMLSKIMIVTQLFLLTFHFKRFKTALCFLYCKNTATFFLGGYIICVCKTETCSTNHNSCTIR